MDTEKSISDLIGIAAKEHQVIILIGSKSSEEAQRVLVSKAQQILSAEKFEVINVAHLPMNEIMSHAQLIMGLDGRGVVIIDDSVEAKEENLMRNLMALRQEPITLKITALPHEDLSEVLLVEKKNYGVSKTKKSFSPPKHKGFVGKKFTLRGRHR